MLPNFLVIGAYKCGTTSLHHYLRQHPEIFMANVKEPSYFAFADGADCANPAYSKSVKTREAYEALFEGAEGYRAIGEVSPEYMTNPRAVSAIAEAVPSVRLIAILRNPVDRAFSDYLMYRRDGLEKEVDFVRALELQEARAAQGEATGFYVSTGYYGAQLRAYYRDFPPENIAVFAFEDLARDPSGVLREVFGFLGVDPEFRPAEFVSYNRSGLATNPVSRFLLRNRRSLRTFMGPLVPQKLGRWIRRNLEKGLERPSMPGEARTYLRTIYDEDIQQLKELTGRRFQQWGD